MRAGEATIRGALFDMDGLLIDSEPLWTRAEIEVFGSVGIELDAARCAETVGLGLERVVELRFRERPWSGRSKRDVADAVRRRLVELVREEGKPMPGALEAVAFARSRGARLGLATSSDRPVIEAALEALGLRGAFDHEQAGSEVAHAKPHPDVYLVTAERLGLSPAECVVLEDSIPGLVAAKAAGMRAIAVPEARFRGDPRYSIADVVLGSLRELGDEVWSSL